MRQLAAGLRFYETELTIWRTGEMKGPYHERIAYRLEHGGSVIFDDDQIGVPKGMTGDPDYLISEVIAWLTLRPEDTDIELDHDEFQEFWVHTMDARSLCTFGSDLENDEFDPDDWDNGREQIVLMSPDYEE